MVGVQYPMDLDNHKLPIFTAKFKYKNNLTILIKGEGEKHGS